MTRKITLHLLLALFVSLLAGQVMALPQIDVGLDKGGHIIRPICGTEDIWELRKAELGLLYEKAGCGTEGVCDDPGVRDGSSTSQMTVRIVMHVITNRGSLPVGLTEQDIYDQVDQMNADFAAYNIDFALHRGAIPR